MLKGAHVSACMKLHRTRRAIRAFSSTKKREGIGREEHRDGKVVPRPEGDGAGLLERAHQIERLVLHPRPLLPLPRADRRVLVLLLNNEGGQGLQGLGWRKLKERDCR